MEDSNRKLWLEARQILQGLDNDYQVLLLDKHKQLQALQQIKSSMDNVRKESKQHEVSICDVQDKICKEQQKKMDMQVELEAKQKDIEQMQRYLRNITLEIQVEEEKIQLTRTQLEQEKSAMSDLIQSVQQYSSDDSGQTCTEPLPKSLSPTS